MRLCEESIIFEAICAKGRAIFTSIAMDEYIKCSNDRSKSLNITFCVCKIVLHFMKWDVVHCVFHWFELI